MNGYVHSIETLGTVDGPGLRYVVFLAGCPLRCKYCHNPDTWNIQSGKLKSVEEILNDYEQYRGFLKGGGLTVTGGEPLVQLDFLIELFTEAKKRHIHTCLDTSGATFTLSKVDKFTVLMNVTDLIMLDIKHIDDEEYYNLTKGKLSETKAMMDFMASMHKDVLIRHVIVENITYDQKQLYRLGYYLGGYRNVVAIDVLPYHTMGVNKYQSLGLEYPLKNARTMSKEESVKARKIIDVGIADKLSGIEPRL